MSLVCWVSVLAVIVESVNFSIPYSKLLPIRPNLWNKFISVSYALNLCHINSLSNLTDDKNVFTELYVPPTETSEPKARTIIQKQTNQQSTMPNFYYSIV